MRIIPYNILTSSYLDTFEYDGIEKGMFSFYEIKKRIQEYAISDIYMAVDGRKLIGLAGVIPLYPGIGFAWMLYNNTYPGKLLRIVKEIKKVLKGKLRFYHRIETYCMNVKETCKFLEFIGFKKEGILRQHLGKKDMAMYSIIRGK